MEMEIGSAATLPSPVADDQKIRSEEEVEEGMELFRASKGALRRLDSKILTVFAQTGEGIRKHGRVPTPPPIEIVDYPDFFERAWGWDKILPHDLVTPLPLYKIYLRQYYNRNHQRVANAAGANDLGLDGDDHGNGLLAALVDKCIKTEDTLKSRWNSRSQSFAIDDDEKEVTSVSDDITKRVREMAPFLGSESPAAAIAIKCITKEAELMCQCIISEDPIVSFNVSNAVRRCALVFMTCKDYVPAAAAMLGVMKEAELAIGLLREGCEEKGKIACAGRVRHRTALIMMDLRHECSPVAEPTVDDIAGDLNSNESDKKLADNGDHEEMGNVNENKKEQARNGMDGSNRTDENQNPNDKLGRNSLEKGEEKRDTKARTEAQVDPVGSSNEGYSSTYTEVYISKTDEKNSKELTINDMDGSSKTQENQNPDEELGRKKLGKDKMVPDKVDVPNKKKKLFGRAGGHIKWISGCFNSAKQGGDDNGTAS